MYESTNVWGNFLSFWVVWERPRMTVKAMAHQPDMEITFVIPNSRR